MAFSPIIAEAGDVKNGALFSTMAPPELLLELLVEELELLLLPLELVPLLSDPPPPPPPQAARADNSNTKTRCPK
jgi:hypothetical protein